MSIATSLWVTSISAAEAATLVIDHLNMFSQYLLDDLTPWLKLWDEAEAWAADPEAPNPPSPPPKDWDAALAFEAKLKDESL